MIIIIIINIIIITLLQAATQAKPIPVPQADRSGIVQRAIQDVSYCL